VHRRVTIHGFALNVAGRAGRLRSDRPLRSGRVAHDIDRRALAAGDGAGAARARVARRARARSRARRPVRSDIARPSITKIEMSERITRMIHA
jgi:hypothetical protein